MSTSSNSSPSNNSSLNPSPTNSLTNLSSKSSSSSLKDFKTSTETTISIEEITSENPCLACQSPCSIHPSYPSNLKINHEANLHGTVQQHTRHIIISTGKSDWDKVIELDSGSLSSEIYKYQQQKKGNDDNKILITNSNRQNSSLSFLTFLSFFGNDILIYPDNLIVRNVSTGKVKEFYDQYLLNKSLDDKEKFNFFVEKIPYKAVILICGHKRRDIRCGIAGPILKNEFEKVLKEKRMDLGSIGNQGVPVYLSSHVGGHQFAGNVIVYQNGHGIWYGRVTPCHVPMIIDKTIIEGKIIKELHRGSMFDDKKGTSLDW
ncbi:Sucrase/ferredoxin-like-domain-containing protein [Glomus cerebriforme]|uniref:Sucrase/ferredoxin-like-domain-containing protein n=1 Tax=Glomus cerebriforme TaxID=658196 RepID=A0A397TEX2_9GLOM|nr:Sucrase/ferredoxin-like-domain-containing protein [Glomus cerebriforme]